VRIRHSRRLAASPTNKTPIARNSQLTLAQKPGCPALVDANGAPWRNACVIENLLVRPIHCQVRPIHRGPQVA